MNLIKEDWNKTDGKEFQNYLLNYARPEKVEWTRKILNTNMSLLAILSPELKRITKEILKGNFLSFLDLWLWDYYDNTAINGILISKIKDFEIYKKYLTKFANKVDNWASCDILTFNINKENEEKFFNLALNFIRNKKTFVRRIGFDIFFKFIGNDLYLNKIFEILNDFESEKEYYVNMCIAWFIAECFTKKRDKTLKFLQSNKLNAFTINKAVQKCRDSFRVSETDKEMLLRFKRN